MLEAVTIREIEAIFVITDGLGLSREQAHDRSPRVGPTYAQKSATAGIVGAGRYGAWRGGCSGERR